MVILDIELLDLEPNVELRKSADYMGMHLCWIIRVEQIRTNTRITFISNISTHNPRTLLHLTTKFDDSQCQRCVYSHAVVI